MVDWYIGEVVEVFSGDDLVVLIDLGVDDLYKKKRVRLYGVDTPNAVGQNISSPAGQIRSYVRQLCKGKKVRMAVVTESLRSWVARVEVETSPGTFYCVNDDLISKGYKFNRERLQ